jgi:hypothetical protein
VKLYPSLGVCHLCGVAMPDNAEAAYCSTDCRSSARLAVDLGIRRELPAAWVAAARNRAIADHNTAPKRKTKATPASVT